MPVRIKPSYDLGPCRLYLEGLKGICERVVKDFPNAKFGAVDDVWEIYDETMPAFLASISARDSLNEFTISATKEAERINLKIIFGKREAKVYLVASPEYQDWFEHYLPDTFPPDRFVLGG